MLAAAWLHDRLRKVGLPAICIETRQAHAAMETMPKTDRNNARRLAQIMWRGAAALKREGQAPHMISKGEPDCRGDYGQGDHVGVQDMRISSPRVVNRLR
jgi:hypothetical protein